MEKKSEYTKEGKIYQEIFEGKEKERANNIVKIAGRNIEVYNQTILNKFQKFDQIEICVLDSYIDKALHIIKQWEALGIIPFKGYPIRFEKREEDIVSREGKKFRKLINRITLTKHQDIFRFTKV